MGVILNVHGGGLQIGCEEGGDGGKLSSHHKEDSFRMKELSASKEMRALENVDIHIKLGDLLNTETLK